MKKITEKEEKFIKTEIDVEVFIASNGKRFKGKDAEQEYLKFEEYLLNRKNFDNIIKKKIYLDNISIPSSWYFLQNENDVISFVSRINITEDNWTVDGIGFNDNNENIFASLKLNEWYGYFSNEDGEITIFSFSETQKEMNNFISAFND